MMKKSRAPTTKAANNALAMDDNIITHSGIPGSVPTATYIYIQITSGEFSAFECII
jgi:preprotein translocase subunit YajC